MAIFHLTLFSTAFLLFLVSCKSPQAARPDEHYEAANLETPVSTISIPIKIYKTELQNSINKQLGEVLYEDKNLADDGLMMKATRKENISLEVDNQQIKYRVPLKLWVKKDVAITDVEAEGSLALDFVTNYSIRPDWSLQTTTTLGSHQWLQEPVVKLGFGNLPVTSIANIILNKTKAYLAKEIDKQVGQFFDLKKEMEAAWKSLNEPFELSPDYAAWLMLNPQSIGMTPLKSNGGVVESIVTVVSKPAVSLGEKPAAGPVGKLPAFGYIDATTQDFTVFLNTSVPFSEAEKISKRNLVGETFSEGKKSAKVENIEIYGQGNKLVVNTLLSGSYNGNVYFIAKPAYNEKKNKVELSDVQFDFSSQKALMKTASWLFKGTLKRKVQENLDFYLKYNLDETRNLMQQQLTNFPLANGITLNGNLDDLNVSNVYVAADGIRVRIGLRGKVNLDVKGL